MFSTHTVVDLAYRVYLWRYVSRQIKCDQFERKPNFTITTLGQTNVINRKWVPYFLLFYSSTPSCNEIHAWYIYRYRIEWYTLKSITSFQVHNRRQRFQAVVPKAPRVDHSIYGESTVDRCLPRHHKFLCSGYWSKQGYIKHNSKEEMKWGSDLPPPAVREQGPPTTLHSRV